MSQSPTRLSRRTMFAGAGAAGAVAAVAAMLPSRSPQADAAAAPPRPAPQRGGGYTLSDHVKQYYKTTRV
ncbi:MAG: formate dehydrogenase [Burkholderiaceae bacterium]|nr:formate dehydrogenase [Rhodoferax sp.]MCB2003402.1 formate dehydrogenase [Rhodoferax sp.]MCB2030780.1 formate dehydrogenase [Rhodoferax sp.]MCB2043613.1 formate dehydrogenase [Rhodoferax sp.]MCP5261267.1 formate dehydrogenase [Rhodoferax sp.]